MKHTVLLVHDNPELLEVLCDELCDIYTIVTAANGEEALDILKKSSIQLLFSML